MILALILSALNLSKASLNISSDKSTAYVDLTICVNKDLTVYEGHEIATKLEKRIIKDMQFVKGITVHVEPCINCPGNSCKK